MLDHINRWQFAKEAYDGFDSSYLVKFSREHDDKFKNRQELSYCVNYIKPKAKQFVSYLSQKNIKRDVNNKLLKPILENIDLKNNSIDTFMQNFAINAKVRGVNLCLIDMPNKMASNLQEQLDSRILPYFVEILPESVYSYKLDEFGFFEWIIIETIIDETKPFGEKKVKTIYKYYDKTAWRVFDKDKNEIESGEHNIGVCPIIIFSESGSFPNVGDFVQIADIQKRIMNLRSELDEILRGQTFSLLTYQKPNNASDIDLNIGVNNAILYEGERPDFISPPEAPAKIYQDEIKRLEDLIEKIAHTEVFESTGNESGVAKEYRFQSLNSALINFAKRLEDFERNCFDVACRWLGINNDVVINYPQDFNIKDIKSEIENTDALFALNLGKTYETLKKEQLAFLDLSGLEESQKEQIKQEIEELNQIR